MTSRFLKSAVAAAMTFTLAACPGGDSGPTGPQIQLTEAQTEDMMDALDAIGSASADFRIASASIRQSLTAGANGAALFTVPINETEDCPAGGSTTVSGSENISEDFTSGSIDFNQSYNNCKATSSSGTLWTFNNGLHFTGNFTLSGGSGSMNGTISASSSMGSGNCTVSITYTEDEDSYSASGTVCGKPFSESESF